MMSYPKIFQVAASAAIPEVLMTKVKNIAKSPMAMYNLTEGPSCDPTFSQSLPNEPLRLWFKHTQEVLAGHYLPEVKGALTSTANPWTVAKFHETDRVRKRFLEEFVAAYDSFLIQLGGVDASAEEKQAKEEEEKETAKAEEETAKADKSKKGDKTARLSLFQADAEAVIKTSRWSHG